MDAHDTPRLIYLGLLLAVIGGYFVIANRHRMNQMLQQASIWAFIFVGGTLIAGMWGDIQNTVAPRQTVAIEGGQTVVEVPRAPDGHYYVTLTINDAPIVFIMDTGASDLVLTQADAARAGLDPDTLAYTGRAMTANGEVRTAPVRLAEVRLGTKSEQNVRAVVNRGEMPGSLLGMAYLQHFGRIEIANNTLRLIP